jgi:lipoprotein-anchoring transpeptidase ErfK/SrfK
MVRVREYEPSVAARRLWRIAVLAAAGTVGTVTQAKAQLYYWPDSEPRISSYEPMFSHRPKKPRRHQAKKIEAPAKEAGRPQGPLIIAISIEKQNLKIYDANGFYAQTPISTGMRGHPTPMGVFSVIQKHKFHHSNIYSGAPMPYMQRITWSGVAMHAGVLPGYPASHGCIRMPMAFAVKMWGWTKMGARVVVTPGEMTPASFSHPLLVAQKAQPVAAEEPKLDALPAAKSDKASDAGLTDRPEASKLAMARASLELRSSIGHDDGVKPAMAASSPTIPLREQTRTADASSAMPPTHASVTMTDASGGNSSPRAESAEAKPAEPAKSETANFAAEPATAKRDETASSDDKPVEAKPSEAAIAEVKPAATGASDDSNKTLDGVKTTASKADAAMSDDKPDESVKAATDVLGVPAVKKDQGRPDSEKAVVLKPAPAIVAAPRRSGQISVFISRKDSKLYARQNFAPLFDVPVTIAPSDRPLGTHVFTAQADKNDGNVLHWSVVSLPVRMRYAERRDEDERDLRRHKMAAAVALKAMPVTDSPTEALDRLAIPADAMARITDALSTGGSIIVSDQGITAGETGEGTDFIVALR